MELEKITYSLDELKDVLNEKQKIFCHNYIVDWNTTRSYKKAYGIEDDNSAAVSGHKLLRNTKIIQYIDFIKNDIEKECGISKIRQINELAKIAYSSIAHLHNTWIELKDFELLTNEQKEAIESIDTKIEQKFQYNPDTESKEAIDVKFVKIKLFSKVMAIAEINKMMGYNSAEKIEHSGDITIEKKTVNISIDGKDIDLKV